MQRAKEDKKKTHREKGGKILYSLDDYAMSSMTKEELPDDGRHNSPRIVSSFLFLFYFYDYYCPVRPFVRFFFTRLQKRRRWESNKKEKKKNNRHVTLLEKKRSKDNMGRGSKHDKSIIYNKKKKEKKLWGERERLVGTRDR